MKNFKFLFLSVYFNVCFHKLVFVEQKTIPLNKTSTLLFFNFSFISPKRSLMYSSRSKLFQAKAYWASVSCNVDGMLGGFAHLHVPDIHASKQFINFLKAEVRFDLYQLPKCFVIACMTPLTDSMIFLKNDIAEDSRLILYFSIFLFMLGNIEIFLTYEKLGLTEGSEILQIICWK